MRFTSAQSRKHRGPGAQCGMQPCGRPYVCLRSEDVPTRTLLGPRGDGGGRCARLVAATIAARMWLVGSRAIRSRRDASGACVQYASRAVCRAQCGCERRACRRRGARLSPCNEWRGSVGVNEVHRARVPQHWGTGAQCGMQPCGRPYVCLQTQGLPARALLGPRGDGAGSALRCARRLRGARRVGAGSETSGARRFGVSGCSRVCDRWMRALTLDRERHDTLNVRATHARSINNINYKRARAQGTGAGGRAHQ